jgi:hypothetical protein
LIGMQDKTIRKVRVGKVSESSERKQSVVETICRKHVGKFGKVSWPDMVMTQNVTVTYLSR